MDGEPRAADAGSSPAFSRLDGDGALKDGAHRGISARKRATLASSLFRRLWTV
jgi:hypothetical protein